MRTDPVMSDLNEHLARVDEADERAIRIEEREADSSLDARLWKNERDEATEESK